MNFFTKLPTLFAATKDLLLDLLFPKSGLIREIERMSEQQFASDSASGQPNRRFRGHYPPECAEWSRAILTYRDRHVRAAVWELKYRKNVRVAKLFAELLAIEMKKFPEKIIIVPIPLSEKRRHERGYNQIELILEQLPRDGKWNIAPDLLRRKHHTTSQTRLSRSERLKNLNDCFDVSNSEKIFGSKIMIVDDVMTTGSTLRQARESLLRAGAGEVTAITIAH